MNSVFIGGSRRLSRVNAELARRLDNIIQKKLRVLIGDASGFDRAVQAYLAEHHYSSVAVYCTNGICRNNVGNWPLHAVNYEGRGNGLEFYTAKDDAMLADADYGFFGWDGKSRGTLRNVNKMAECGKPSAVYVSPTRRFVTVRTLRDLAQLVPESAVIKAPSEDLFSENWHSDAMSVGPTSEHA